ncbi:MAG TPA: ATP-binding protein, partial [Polyangia bacterium]|nr:ATP-binding protein [Polyangia bacterium]
MAVFADLFRKARQIHRQEEELLASERRRSEEALRDSEALFEATFDQAAIGIAHATLDGRWVRTNRRLGEILATPRHRLSGTPIADVVHSASRMDLREGLSGLAVGAEKSFSRECRLLRSGGSDVWAEMTVSTLCDQSGTPKTLIVVVEDVSERKCAEVRQVVLAAASETLLSSLDPAATLDAVTRLAVAGFAHWCALLIHENGKVSVAHCDGDQEAELRSICETFLPAREGGDAGGGGDQAADLDAIGGKRPALVMCDSSEALAASGLDEKTRALLAGMACRSALVVPITFRQRRIGLLVLGADSNRRQFTAADLATAEDLAHRIAFAVDNARLYREAQEAIGARDEFLSIASHELRTPLTPLQIQIELLLRQSRGDLVAQPEKLAKIVDRSQRQVRRLEILIDNLLDVSRASAGRLQLEFETVELVEVVREVAGRFSDELAAAGSALTIETAPSVVGKWDRLRMEQVVTNLVGNAIKYGGGRPIEVRLEGTSDQARLLVRDHGIGIEPTKIGRLFERFERAVPSRSYGGLGLGLYI